MTSIIFVTQVIDPGDAVLGFVVRQLQALTERGARLVVIANEVRSVPADLGAEMISLGKEHGHGRARRLARYEYEVARLARRLRPATLFAHMCPIYLNAGAPAVKAQAGRTMLWFAHPSDTPTLAVAERLADAVLTTLPGSYPRRSPKVRVVGQAIDTRQFAPGATDVSTTPCRLLALGRTSPVKDYPTILRGVAEARARRVEVSVRLAGPSVTLAEREHRRELVRLIDELHLTDAAWVEDGMAHEMVSGRLAQATALVNATRTGSADKSVFEAMACGRPVLYSNTALSPLLDGAGMDLRFEDGDAASLGGAITALAATPPDAVGRTGAELRARVERGHSLDHWADSVLAVAAELHGDRRATVRT